MNIKEERFKRIAEKRVNKLLEDLRLLGNCSNKANYQYSEQDVKKILSVIDKELRKLKEKFEGDKNIERFSL